MERTGLVECVHITIYMLQFVVHLLQDWCSVYFARLPRGHVDVFFSFSSKSLSTFCAGVDVLKCSKNLQFTVTLH